MDDTIICETKVDSFLATTSVKPMISEKKRYTQKELQERGKELDKALDKPMPENFFESNIESNLSTSISKEEDEKMETEVETLKGAHYAKDMLEEIRICKKSDQALYDLAGLLYLLSYEKIYDSVSGAALFFRVLRNLEDSEIEIGYQGESLEEESRELYRKMDKIREKYSEVIPDIDSYLENVSASNIDEYLFKSHFIDKNGNSIRWYDQPYNLIESLIASDSIKWLKELLLSSLESERRLEILDEIITSNKINLEVLVDDSNYPDSVYPAVWDNEIYEENKKKSIDRINGLIKSWAEQRTIDNEYEMLRDMRLDNLKFLQISGMIDFVRDIRYTSEYGNVTVPAQICVRQDGIYYFDSFYDTESYKNLPDEIRQNTDKYLIHNIVAMSSKLEKLIQLKNFELTDRNVQEIISALGSCDEVYEWEFRKIYEAIEKKATTPKEYRKAQQIIKQIQDALDPEKLKEVRQALATRFFNMVDSLQEQVPGKMKIKDIPFQVKKN